MPKGVEFISISNLPILAFFKKSGTIQSKMKDTKWSIKEGIK